MKEIYILFSCPRCGRAGPSRKVPEGQAICCSFCGEETIAWSKKRPDFRDERRDKAYLDRNSAETGETRKISFYCAQTGAEFFVLFRRESVADSDPRCLFSRDLLFHNILIDRSCAVELRVDQRAGAAGAASFASRQITAGRGPPKSRQE